MNGVAMERLHENLQRLPLFKSRERLDALLQDATTRELRCADFRDQLLTEEVTAKTAKNLTMRTHLARFPLSKAWRPSSGRTNLRSTRSRSCNWPRATSSSLGRTC